MTHKTARDPQRPLRRAGRHWCQELRGPGAPSTLSTPPLHNRTGLLASSPHIIQCIKPSAHTKTRVSFLSLRTKWTIGGWITATEALPNTAEKGWKRDEKERKGRKMEGIQYKLSKMKKKGLVFNTSAMPSQSKQIKRGHCRDTAQYGLAGQGTGCQQGERTQIYTHTDEPLPLPWILRLPSPACLTQC